MATVSSAWGEKHDHIHLGEFNGKRVPNIRIVQPEDILVPKLTHIIMFYRDWIGEFRYKVNKLRKIYKHFKEESKITDLEN